MVGGTEGVFAYEVRTNYVSLNSTGISPDPAGKVMMQIGVTAKWDGGNKTYTTTGLVSQQSPEAE